MIWYVNHCDIRNSVQRGELCNPVDITYCGQTIAVSGTRWSDRFGMSRYGLENHFGMFEVQ